MGIETSLDALLLSFTIGLKKCDIREQHSKPEMATFSLDAFEVGDAQYESTLRCKYVDPVSALGKRVEVRFYQNLANHVRDPSARLRSQGILLKMTSAAHYEHGDVHVAEIRSELPHSPLLTLYVPFDNTAASMARKLSIEMRYVELAFIGCRRPIAL